MIINNIDYYYTLKIYNDTLNMLVPREIRMNATFCKENRIHNLVEETNTKQVDKYKKKYI